MNVFAQFDHADVRALVAQYPLAWVCAGGGADLASSQLPLVGVYDRDGRLVELIGHLMKSNPLCHALEADARATILFSGPDAYVSPAHAGLSDWAPTWNYAQLTINASLVLDDDFTETALNVLIEAMEAGREQPWTVSELGARYNGMLGRIIGFRATVTHLSGKFKLGQDEGDDTLGRILSSLPDGETVAWMRRLNRQRL